MEILQVVHNDDDVLLKKNNYKYFWKIQIMQIYLKLDQLMFVSINLHKKIIWLLSYLLTLTNW